MMRRLPILLACFALCSLVVAQTVDELQQKIDALTIRVEALEGKPIEEAPDLGRKQARELYDEVDQLLAQGKLEQAHRVIADFNRVHAGTPTATWTGSLLREMEVVGKDAPGDWFIEEWYQGESNADLNGSGVTLLLFWESWCPHCRNEVPKFQTIHETQGRDGLQVVGVTRLTRDATEESVKSFVRENGVSYPIARESGELANYFNVKGIPAVAVIKGGKIVWRGHPQRLTDSMLSGWAE